MSGPTLSRFILITCISLISFFPINILLPSFPALSAQFDTPTADVALSTLLVPMLTIALSFIVLTLWGLITNRQTTARALPA